MAKISVNKQRSDPYKNFKFRFKWDGKYIAKLGKADVLKRNTELMEDREVGDSDSTLISPG